MILYPIWFTRFSTIVLHFGIYNDFIYIIIIYILGSLNLEDFFPLEDVFWVISDILIIRFFDNKFIFLNLLVRVVCTPENLIHFFNELIDVERLLIFLEGSVGIGVETWEDERRGRIMDFLPLVLVIDLSNDFA